MHGVETRQKKPFTHDPSSIHHRVREHVLEVLRNTPGALLNARVVGDAIGVKGHSNVVSAALGGMVTHKWLTRVGRRNRKTIYGAGPKLWPGKIAEANHRPKKVEEKPAVLALPPPTTFKKDAFIESALTHLADIEANGRSHRALLRLARLCLQNMEDQ